MAEMILPGVYIEVRPEGLIVPGRVSVGNLGVVGTASKGEIGKPITLGSYAQAREQFGSYDPWIDASTGSPKEGALTLVRALQIAYDHGASTVIAVRVGKDAAKATYLVPSAGGDCVTLTAKSEGTWGDELQVNVWGAEEDALVEDENVLISGAGALKLKHSPVLRGAQNRITIKSGTTGVTRAATLVYDDAQPPLPGQIQVKLSDGTLTFSAGEAPSGNDKVTAFYLADKGQAVKVTLRLGQAKETYSIVSGDDLVGDINRETGGSQWVKAAVATNSGELPTKSAGADIFAPLKGGTDGIEDADYAEGLRKLTYEPAHIILAAGQDDSFAADLDAHCQNASNDLVKRDRIAVVGGRGASQPDELFNNIRSHNVSSDRVILVGPGIKIMDSASGKEVTLPSAYAAAAVAGLLAGFSPHVSPTNKTLRVRGLERRFTPAELAQLIQNRVLALEERQGYRILQGITTATNTAWKQITTRRIVDYAKYGVRSAAEPYIGLLNNTRVRGAMRATINSFLAEMVDDEMLVSYQLDVTATRDEEIKGIARVTLTLQPTFSIDYIKVTMFLG
jgi:hypothetical protein